MKKRTWRSPYYNAVMANMASENSPHGSLAKKHTGKVSLRYALETQAVWRAERIKKIAWLSGVIGVIAFVVINWQ